MRTSQRRRVTTGSTQNSSRSVLSTIVTEMFCFAHLTAQALLRNMHGLCDQAVSRDELEQVPKKFKARKAVGPNGTYHEISIGGTDKELNCWTAALDWFSGRKCCIEWKADKKCYPQEGIAPDPK